MLRPFGASCVLALPSTSFLRRCSHRHGAIVNLAVVLQLVAAALPPGAEDEIVLIEHLPGRQVHLQDFFWTGAEDAPPWLANDQMLAVYEPRPMHHNTPTVYVPNSPGEGEPTKPADCPTCPVEPTPSLLHEVDQDIGVLIGEDPGQRYWLLTVLKPGENVPPKIELRLARLYKAAFARQQQRHLGLAGPEYRAHRAIPKRQIISENQTLISQMTELSQMSNPPARESRFGRSLLQMRPVRIVKSRRTSPIIDGGDEHDGSRALGATANNTERPRPRSPQLVQVRMQNTSLMQDGATRLVYTVHLGGKPVPAETAAKDMALLSAQEVALELGAPVVIQSEPYLKESHPLALSRKRDAWLLLGATGVGLLLLCAIVLSLLIFTKRKRAQSAVAVPPPRRKLAKDVEGYAPTTPGIDNTAYTSETEARTEATSGRKRTTPGTLSRTPGSQDTLEADRRDAMVGEFEHRRGQAPAKVWDTRECSTESTKKGLPTRRSVQRSIDRPRSLESPDSAVGGEGQLESLESLEKEDEEAQQATGSPHSYLSMPSCKQFPNMRNVEPLSKVLEPLVVKHLDLEFDSPEMKQKNYDSTRKNGDYFFTRSASEYKDNGASRPIVWDWTKKRLAEGTLYGLTDPMPTTGPTFTLAFNNNTRLLPLTVLVLAGMRVTGTRQTRSLRRADWFQGGSTESAPAASDADLELGRLADAGRTRLDSLGRDHQQQQCTIGEGPHEDEVAVAMDNNRGKSAHVSSVAAPISASAPRPRTSLPRNGETEPSIPETGQLGPQPRSAWGSRPLSAGPFHRPNLPEVEVVRVLAEQPLRADDPAVPLISSIKKELCKFSY
ncbi:uncharacterized protein LOC106636591 [Copidosoma floridanum]|uniref:uncharacterized protein LOC106636591 n=1 Tax=Copidosoma floridanum TaxID=29053 RepID=UPI0006C93E84|nr:uncharacterized protein LOC106636591 [Copidosoma floridanum]